jgi:hypothetical protein
MPNNYNFDNLKFVNELKINPIGWINPLYVEYGIGGYPEDSYFWRVKNTSHTFVIPAKRINYITLGNYVKHFEEALQSFREDYLSWANDGFCLDWQQEYNEQFKRFIII